MLIRSFEYATPSQLSPTARAQPTESSCRFFTTNKPGVPAEAEVEAEEDAVRIRIPTEVELPRWPQRSGCWGRNPLLLHRHFGIGVHLRLSVVKQKFYIFM